MASLQQGQIVWIETGDQAGRNPKCRPAVIITDTSEIQSDAKLVVVAATGTFSKPHPQNRIELPWKRPKHPVTGLYKRCVAVCDWLVEIDHRQIKGVGGVVPPHILAQILAEIPRE